MNKEIIILILKNKNGLISSYSMCIIISSNLLNRTYVSNIVQSCPKTFWKPNKDGTDEHFAN